MVVIEPNPWIYYVNVQLCNEVSTFGNGCLQGSVKFCRTFDAIYQKRVYFHATAEAHNFINKEQSNECRSVKMQRIHDDHGKTMDENRIMTR